MSSLMAERGPIHVHVGGTALFEGEPPDYERFIEHVAERLELIPRFRRRVRYLPGKVMRAEWEDDPQFDVRRHVRHIAVPAPGTDEQLRELVGQVMSEPLDQGRPLWQLYLIERCGDGGERGFAAVSKTHHALVDGVSAVDVGAVILDPDPNGTDLGLAGAPWAPKERATREVFADRLEDASRKLLGLSRGAARRALDPRTPQAASQSAFRTAQGFLDLARNSDPVKPTFLNETIGRDRRVAFASTTLAEMKRIAAASSTGATVNDVVLAVSTGAFRELFLRRGEPVPTEFAALVPMSIRKPGEELSLGNRITTLMVPLPLAEPDPIARLRVIHRTTERLKGSEAARAASIVIDASGWVPPTMSRVLGSVGEALGPVRGVVPQRLPWNLVISNVPGPPMPVYLLGRRLRSIHPFVALSPQRRALSIGVISYDGGLHFGLVGDRDVMADIDRLAGFIEDELEALGAG
jgi:WS/DGAT/MGAT family acyltransferase